MSKVEKKGGLVIPAIDEELGKANTLVGSEKPLDADPNIALNEAAAKLMAMLPQTVREMLMETAVVTLKLPLWQLWAGLVQQSYDLGLYTTPILDPDWINRLPVMPTLYATVRCKECGEPFSPKWPKQEYCSDLCGTKPERRRLDAVALERQGQVRRPLGQEAPGAVSSAMRYDSGVGTAGEDGAAH